MSCLVSSWWMTMKKGKGDQSILIESVKKNIHLKAEIQLYIKYKIINTFLCQEFIIHWICFFFAVSKSNSISWKSYIKETQKSTLHMLSDPSDIKVLLRIKNSHIKEKSPSEILKRSKERRSIDRLNLICHDSGFHCTFSFLFKWNSHQNATKALFVIEYESNLRVNA